MTDKEPEIDPKLARVLAAQFYVAKNLTRDPAKTVNFIRLNRDYFPAISDNELSDIIRENNLTEEDISKESTKVKKFADIDFEEKLAEKNKKESDEYMKDRPKDSVTRDYGRGSAVSGNYPTFKEPNFYKTAFERKEEEEKEKEKETKSSVTNETIFPEMEKLFAQFKVNLKEKEFEGSVKLG